MSGQRIANKYGCFWDTIDNHIVLDIAAPNDAKQAVIAVDTQEHPVIAFIETVLGAPANGAIPFEDRVYVKRWNGTQWVQVGTQLSTGRNDIGGYLSIAIDNTNAPVIAWTERNRSTLIYEAYVSRWNNVSGQWDSLGGLLNSPSNLSTYTGGVVIDGTHAPVVALVSLTQPNQFDTRVLSFGGTAWTQLGNTLLSAYPRALTVDGTTG